MLSIQAERGLPRLRAPGNKGTRRHRATASTADIAGSAGHGSRVKWVNKSEWVTWVNVSVPVTHDFVFSDTVETYDTA